MGNKTSMTEGGGGGGDGGETLNHKRKEETSGNIARSISDLRNNENVEHETKDGCEIWKREKDVVQHEKWSVEKHLENGNEKNSKKRERIYARGSGSSDFLELKNETPISEKYVISSEQLGSGHYGIIRRCRNKETWEVFAVKSIKKSRVTRIRSLSQEIEIMKMVDHPNIIQLYEVYEDERYIHLIIELCEGGGLFDRIIRKSETVEGRYSESHAAKIMKKIVSGIEYCHNVHHICHRDLKPENFLFKTMYSDDDIKIIDFGLSCINNKYTGSKVPAHVGTPYYMAPEIFEGVYGKPCDMWSLGVITYILLSGYPPFGGNNNEEIFVNIKAGELCFPSPEWDGISYEGKMFISQLLVRDSTKRLTASEAMKHPWLNGPPIVSTLRKNPSSKQLKLSIRLRRFIGMNKLKRVALNVIAQQLSEAQIGNMREAFIKMDKDGDGEITIDELEQTLKEAGLETLEYEAERLIHGIDINGNNTLDYREFLAATMKRRLFIEEENMKVAFAYFDASNTGVISKTDLEMIFSSEEHVLEILDHVDANCDGVIQYNEFRDMMLSRERNCPS